MRRTILIVLAVTAVVLVTAALLLFFKRPLEIRWTAENALVKAPPHALRDDGDAESLRTAISASLAYFSKQQPEERFRFGPRTVTAHELRTSLESLDSELAKNGLSDDLYRYIDEHFEVYSSAAQRVLFTGYYEASLRGSLTRTDTFAHPLYRAPDDMVKIELPKFFSDPSKWPDLPSLLRARVDERKRVVPYFSREEIEGEHKLAGRQLELVWVDDPVEAYFLQIQGSGVVTLSDGSKRRVGYAEKNGREWKPIGRYLAKEGLIEKTEVSGRTIKAFLRAHPEHWPEVYRYDPSYVFFTFTDKGPLGDLNVVLTPYRSVATDRSLFPKGALAFIDLPFPVVDEEGNVTGTRSLHRFVLNQDTGGAIKGPGRVDIFSGSGRENEETAGAVKNEGDLYFLVPSSKDRTDSARDQSQARASDDPR